MGSQNLYDSGATTATTETVSGLPTNGVTLYARLWWEVSGVWTSADYTYTEAGTPVLPVLTTPTPGSTLSGSSVAFTWTAGTGPVEMCIRDSSHPCIDGFVKFHASEPVSDIYGYPWRCGLYTDRSHGFGQLHGRHRRHSPHDRHLRHSGVDSGRRSVDRDLHLSLIHI